MSISKVLSKNKKAYFDYEIVDKYTAGIVLTGAEVKSVRGGGTALVGSYVSFRDGGVWLIGAKIRPYAYARIENQDPDRPKKLLLTSREISKLQGVVGQKGVTLIPLEVVLEGRYIKVIIGVCRGKKKWDKRETLKKRSIEKRLRQREL